MNSPNVGSAKSNKKENSIPLIIDVGQFFT